MPSVPANLVRTTAGHATGNALSPKRWLPSLAFLFVFAVLSGCSAGAGRFIPFPEDNYSKGMLHRVQRGECLSTIARHYRRSVRLLAALNHLKPPYPLRAGEFVYIPPENNDSVVREKRITLGQIKAAKQFRRSLAGVRKKPVRPVQKTASQGKPDRTKSAALLKDRAKSRKTAAAKVPAKRFVPLKIRASRPVPLAPPKRVLPRFIWPLEGKLLRGYAEGGPLREAYEGVDIGAPAGTQIRAASEGLVLRSQEIPYFGKMVMIDHGGGFATVYSHNSKNLVRQGQRVAQGQPIARVGSSGKGHSGPHLHLQLRYNGVATDPAKYFPRRRKWVANRKQ